MTARRVLRALGMGAALAAGVVGAPVEAGAQAALRAGATPSLDAPVVSDLQEILLDLRIGRVAGRTVRALTDGEAALLPAVALLELGEVDHAYDAEAGVLHAALHPGDRRVVVAAGASSASLAGALVPIPRGAVVLDGGSLYVAAPLLEELFGLTIRTSWVDLTAVVMDPEALPLGRRVAREARWRSLRGEAAGGPAPALELDQAKIGGAVLDWTLSSNVDDPYRSTAYAAGFGARVLGGALQLSARSLGAASAGAHRVDATYQTVWRDSPWITQMLLGDGFSTGPRIRSLRGVSLTNAPYLRRSFFGTDSFAGRVGPGWDVELRQSGQTLDLTRADEQGAFALDIPLRYGANSVEVVAFGPHGEVVTTERLFLLDTDRLPGRRLEWGLSGGRCRDARCALTGNLDLRYGLSDRWTLRAGAEAFGRDSLASVVQPYVGITGAAVPGLELSAEALRAGFLRGGATYAPSSRLRVRGAYTAFSTELAHPVLHDARRRATTEADVFVRPSAGHPRWYVQGAVMRQEMASGTLSLWQAASTFAIGATGIELGLRREVDAPALGADRARNFQQGSVTGLLPLPARRKLWYRAEAELLDARALHRMHGRVAYQLTPSARLELGTGWQHSIGTSFTLSLTADLSRLRTTTQLVAAEGAPARLTQLSQGTVHWNEAFGQMSFAAGPGLERGGISGYVFVDDNGNGVRDPGERGLEGVRVVVGGRTVRTDAEGRLGVWDLVPFEPVRVWADSASIEDPTLVPVRGEVEVTVPPASFGRLDVPVTPSREILGRVVREGPDGDEPVPHAELELVDVGTGMVRAVRAYSDGGFYESGVKPGSYELRVAPGSLRGLGLVPEVDALRLDVRPGSGGTPLSGLVVRLLPEPIQLQGGGGR